ncbi:hypothetical protein DSECCO2_19110 [anaerobic digester metagenome]
MIHKFRVKREHWLLLLLFVLNIVLRIPTTPHGPDGGDSSFVWSLANSISGSGDIVWMLNPLSFFGIYAVSYPSGYPVVLSIVAQVTGIDTEHVILICGFLLGVVGMLASYIMALKFSKNHLLAFFTAFAFSTAPVFVEMTRWTTTTRGLFVALLPLLFWGIFSFNKNTIGQKKVVFLSAFVFITLLSVHRTSYLIVPVIFALVVTMIIWHIKDKEALIPLAERIPKNAIPVIIGLLCVCSFSLQFSGLSFLHNIWWVYQTGAFATGTDVFSLLLNMTTNYIGKIGILLPAGIIGFLILVKKPERGFYETFIIITIIPLLAISALGLYVALILLPIVALLISLTLSTLVQSRGVTVLNTNLKFSFSSMKTSFAKALSIALAISLLVSICFSGYMIERHLYLPAGGGNKVWMTDDVPLIGNYLESIGETAFTSNNGVMASRIYASTGVPVFGRGYDGMNGLINGWIDKDDIEVQMASLSSLSISTNFLFQQVNTPPLKVENNVRAYVADNMILGDKDLGIKIYDNNERSIWFL